MKFPEIKFNYLIIFVAYLSLSSCISASKNFTAQLDKEPLDAIIVPGYPFEDGKWCEIIKLRVYWAKYLFENGMTKNIIFSGSAVYTPYVESKIMALYAMKIGIPEENIFLETQAEHSTENLYYSYKLAKSNGFNNIALATDPFQDMFLKKHIENMDLNEIKSLPMLFKKMERKEMFTPEINPELAFVENFVSLKERQDKKTRKKGSKGMLIKYDQGDSPAEKQQLREVKIVNSQTAQKYSYIQQKDIDRLYNSFKTQ